MEENKVQEKEEERMEENKVQEKEEERMDCDEANPGVVIQYTDDAQTHRVLNLPAVAAGLRLPARISGGVPALQPGATPANSAANLKRWVDQVAVALCRADPFVMYCNNTRAHGLYHQMRQAEHQRFIAVFTNLHRWTGECIANNISAGQLFSVEPAERGNMSMIHLQIGCFL